MPDRSTSFFRAARAGVSFVALAALVSSSLGAAGATLSGCSSQAYLAVMPGVLNDPSNRTLRRELLGFGTDSLCKEMMKRSIPLKLREDDPTIGRFYPRQCNIQTLDNGDLYIQFSGAGFAWSNLTKRIGFNASAAIQYEQDFRLDGSTMYVYFRPSSTTQKKFEVVMTEAGNLQANPLGGLIPGGSAQGFANQVGEGLLAHEIGRGFTVVRDSDGSVEFSIGLLEPGQRPDSPYKRNDRDRLVYVNERIELHSGQRDYVGPIEVPDKGMALYLTMQLEGAPNVDLMVFHRSVGDGWLQGYLTTPVASAPPGPGLLDETVTSSSGAPMTPQGGFPTTVPSQGPAIFRRMIRVPKGAYYVVLDNTATAGKSAPPTTALDDRAALVSLAVELGDAP
ncbi:MAG TPA: hypothetical protein VL400_10805 [Polyangiaceae bacterium]|nr:hypothetical protein [Polyangiaceae bacterium]